MKTPKRVCIVSESPIVDANGVANSVRHVARRLTQRGVEVLIIAPRGRRQMTLQDRIDGVEIREVPSISLARFASQKRKKIHNFHVGLPLGAVTRLVKRFEPDLIHLASPMVLGLAGMNAAKLTVMRRPIPVVAVFQTDVVGFGRLGQAGELSQTARAVFEQTVLRLERSIHSRADVNLAPSTPTQTDLLRRGYASDIWGRGVNSELFHPNKRSPELRAQLLTKGHDTIIVGYVGRLAPEKRVELLKVANALGKKVQLVLVGPGTDEHVRELQEVLPDAIFTGEMRGEKLAQIFASFDIFVHTGPAETFCQTLQEAMASGLPVIAPASGGPLDFVKHGENGLFFQAEAGAATEDSLLKALSYLVDNPEARARWGAAGRAYAETRTWPKLVDELLDVHYAKAMELSAERSTFDGPAGADGLSAA